MEETKTNETQSAETKTEETNKNTSGRHGDPKIKTRQGSGYLKQLYSTARTTTTTTHSHLKNLTTFLVNFVPIDKVDASEYQMRVHFDDAEISALSQSVKEHGVLQPILVVQDGERYQVVAGERRLRASKVAGLDRIPVRILATHDKATREIALRENLDRIDLHPIEEGEGYLSLLETQAYTSHDAIAKAFGKPKSRITECIGFTRLPQMTKDELLRTGIKNRALLRQLLTIPPERHVPLILDSAGKEEVLEMPDGTTISSPKGAKNPTPATGPVRKPFSYQVTPKGIQVQKFKWKRSEGSEALTTYIAELKQLLTELEALT